MSPPTSLDLPTLKHIRNSIIGSPSTKITILHDIAFLPSLLPLLTHPLLKREAVTILASLCKEQDCLPSLINAGVSTPLLSALRGSGDAALARALTELVARACEAVYGARAGLGRESYEGREDAFLALEEVLDLDGLDAFLPLLAPTSPTISASSSTGTPGLAGATAVANLISHLRPAHVPRILDWLPPSDRASAAKGKRGWEKKEEGGWVLVRLCGLVKMGDEKAQIAALNALSTLLSRNTPLITLFGRSHAPTAQTAYTLSRSRSPQVRLAACHILTSLLCHTTPRGLKGDAVLDPPGMLELAVLSTLQGLVEDGEDPEVRSGACWCLSTLVMDSPPRASHASQSGLLLTLCTLLRSFPSIGSTPEALDELYEESPSLLSLRESSMTCLASLTLPSVSLRTSLAALQPPVLPIIHSSLSHPSPGVRHAALQVIRALSRSVEVLRSSLVDEGVVKGVLGLVMRGGGVEEGEGLEGFGLEEEREEGQEQTDDVEAEGGDETMDDDALASANSSMTVKGVDTDKGTGKVKEDMPGEAVKGDRRVLLAALAALCNFSADFSPVQELLPEEHALPLLVQYATQPSDALLRLNGIWVLKNLVYRADWALKSQVMGLVGWSRFIELCRDPDLGVREQALSMVRNLAAGRETDVVQTVRAIGAEELVALVEEAMGTGNDDVQMNALFVLVNTLPELYRSRCMLHQSPAFLSALLLSLSSPSQTLRVAAIRAVHAFLQLSVGKQELREAGIERRVREMDGKPKLGGRRSSGLPALGEFGVAGEVEGSLEVRETVRKVVDFFEAA